VKLKTSTSERKVTIDKAYYQGGLYNIVELSKEAEKIAGEMFKDAVKLLIAKIQLTESESLRRNSS
jgi:outer membrane lipopolysaccharide assembly protein LptE/RlpB